MQKIRTIITQDAEVDDQNSLRHFLLYANEVELQGIVQTASVFHWEGYVGARHRETDGSMDFQQSRPRAPYDEPHSWPGFGWIFRQIAEYAEDYPNLCKHAEGYPTPEYLRSIVRMGNVGYEGETELSTPGSDLIKARILDDDPRPLYLQVWGGTNTIARALMEIQAENQGKPGWAGLHRRLSEKIFITACGMQDPTYYSYIAEEWPDILFVKTLQMKSYAYFWTVMPEGESKDTLRGEFMRKYILNGKSALTHHYNTWLDGNLCLGMPKDRQPGVSNEGAQGWIDHGMATALPGKYDFLSEGDSPTYFLFFDWGFRTLEDYSYGGIIGRYHRVEEQNSKGQPLNLWDVSLDDYTDRDGVTTKCESMWPYVADIQRDFAARVAWCAADTYGAGEHAPTLSIREGLDLRAAPGETVTLTALPGSRDGKDVTVTFRLYQDASADCMTEAILRAEGPSAQITLPESALPGDKLHVVVKAQQAGEFRLVHYQQVILTVE